MSTDDQKRVAAEYGAGLVADGMTVGLGSGSTAELAVHALGLRFQGGLRFVGVPTSRQTAQIARSYGIPLTRLDERTRLDLNLDGADEVDPQLNLIKGHGGALLREKLVARAAARFVVIVDESKRVDRLGEKSPVPVEVAQFGWPATKHRLEALQLVCERRGASHPYVTLNHNYILDCRAGSDVAFARGEVADAIKLETGVVEHGLFLGIAALVVVGKADGGVEVLEARS